MRPPIRFPSPAVSISRSTSFPCPGIVWFGLMAIGLLGRTTSEGAGETDDRGLDEILSPGVFLGPDASGPDCILVRNASSIRLSISLTDRAANSLSAFVSPTLSAPEDSEEPTTQEEPVDISNFRRSGNSSDASTVRVEPQDYVLFQLKGKGPYYLHMEPTFGNRFEKVRTLFLNALTPAATRKVMGIEVRLCELTLRDEDDDIAGWLPRKGWIRRMHTPRAISEKSYGNTRDGWVRTYGSVDEQVFTTGVIYQRGDVFREWETRLVVDLPELIRSDDDLVKMTVKGSVQAETGGYRQNGNGAYWANPWTIRIWGVGVPLRSNVTVSFKNDKGSPLLADFELPPPDELPETFEIHVDGGPDKNSGAYVVFRYSSRYWR